jgi:GH24 family phage-related lysozyme (muramidase)/biotin carboxyl carrier protein
VGKTLDDLVAYQPTQGQSFGPETGNQRSYGPHGGIDFDCRVGGCAGADVASPISGTVISIRQIGTSANGGSFQIDIDGADWDGAVTHQLVHVDSILVKLGDTVKAGQTVAKVSPTDTVSTGPHLDWKIKRNGAWVNPQKWAATAIEKGRSPATPQTTIDLIKSFEGFHPTPYWDHAQHSWGYGTKAPGATGTITREQAESELIAYLDRNCFPSILPMNLPENKNAALASLCYNIGPAQFQQSETFIHATNGDHALAANAFMNLTKASVQVLPGLVTRRQKEMAVYRGSE